MLSWGTLDPVAAFLLGRGAFLTRDEAERAVEPYYQSEKASSRTDPLDARSIRDWCEATFQISPQRTTRAPDQTFAVRLVDDAVAISNQDFNVVPLFTNDAIQWADVAGYVLAVSSKEIHDVLRETDATVNDFVLKPSALEVVMREYI
ncbi:MAG: hypothetical protein ACOVQM_12040 [Pirellula sp.]